MNERHVRPVIVTWGVTLLGVLLGWWILGRFGVFGDLLKPLLVLALGPAVWRSWRWFHARRASDRRDHERRHDKRREDN